MKTMTSIAMIGLFYSVIMFEVVLDVLAMVPDPRIVELLLQADSSPDDAAIVSIEQTILAILFSTGMAVASTRICSRHVGVHKCNRYGFGVSWARFHRLGQKIMRLGFSWNACSNIICIEDDGDNENHEFTMNMQRSSEGYGKQKRHELKYFSLGGGHLNQLFVALEDGVPSSIPSISIDGRMSKQKVMQKHPAWGEAFVDGLIWTSLNKDLPKLYPTLCNLIQRARNAVSQTHSSETIIELILEIVSLATDMEKKTGAPPDWNAVEQIVLQSEPPNADSIAILCNWVVKYGAHSADALKDFVYTCVPADREINVDVLVAVSKWPADADNTFPEVALALVMAEYNCPADKIEHGVCKFLKPSTIAGLVKEKDTIKHANSLLQSFKKWTSEVGLKPEWKIAMDGKLFNLVARMLCEASVPEDMADCKLEAALCKIANTVIDLPASNFSTIGGMCNNMNPWAQHAK